MDAAANNALTIDREIAWFDRVVDTRIRLYFEQDCDYESIRQLEPPPVDGDESAYAGLVRRCSLAFDERLLLILALVPDVRPQALDTFFVHNKNFDRGFTEFGGRGGKSHGGFLPTCETAMFLLAGNDIGRRFECMRLFDRDHVLLASDVLRIDRDRHDEPALSSALLVSPEWLDRLTSGVTHKPDFSSRFPARLITTQYRWDELVLPMASRRELEDIITWAKTSQRILSEWGFAKYFKPGYRSLFYGPPGTGKTLAATLIGKEIGADVYRIDISMVVSKYVGETEKNLAGVFDQAENKHWILFFDEADALFGARTSNSSANDRYSNQEVAYLLQRIEDFPGMVLLASNLRANIDDAFTRRFQSIVHFPMPESELREKLWTMMLTSQCALDEQVDVPALAEAYELSGGSINNVVRYAAIQAAQAERPLIRGAELLQGVVRELAKEGRTP